MLSCDACHRRLDPLASGELKPHVLEVTELVATAAGAVEEAKETTLHYDLCRRCWEAATNVLASALRCFVVTWSKAPEGERR